MRIPLAEAVRLDETQLGLSQRGEVRLHGQGFGNECEGYCGL